MGYESCAQRYAGYFTPKLKEIFRHERWSVPYILELLDTPCDDYDCSHNVFYAEGKMCNRKVSNKEPVDTEWTLQCRRCMCLLDLIPHHLSSTEIAKAFRMTRQAVNLIEHGALQKMRMKLGIAGQSVARKRR